MPTTPAALVPRGDEPPSGQTTALALGISFAILCSIVIGGLAYWFLRRRRKRKIAEERAEAIMSHRRTRMAPVEPSDLAARVTPFGVDTSPVNEGPRFEHKPGENMRAAYRRSDGGWEFGEPAATSPPPTTSFDLMRETTLPSSKEKQLRPGELTTRGYVEDDDADGVPPPAYDVAESSVGTEAPR